MKNERYSGILMHISSLSGSYGIGTMGVEARRFVDFLHETNQKIWQILPLGHTGYGDSPYQCYSAFAGNPLFIDLNELTEKGYLNHSDIPTDIPFGVTEFNTQRTTDFVLPLLRKAAANFHTYESECTRNTFNDFCNENAFWLDDYSLFVALRDENAQQPWYAWDTQLKMREPQVIANKVSALADDILFYKTVQYFFYMQWNSLKSYANIKGVQIFGDIPLYVSYDSSDAWAQPELFAFNAEKNPEAVAGVPPDYFSVTGQLWGNPLYNWDYHVQTGFAWWIQRVKASFGLYNLLRIDHFRGLADFWAVPYGEETAIKGKWLDAPGDALFTTLFDALGKLPIIAEDLGVITNKVEELREKYNFPGMKILQFAFDSSEENEFMPHNFIRNCVVYTGTHDNDTTVGWYNSASETDQIFMHKYFRFSPDEVHRELIRLAWASVAYIAIAPMQDFLGLSTEHRMNLPGKPSGYWRWRIEPDAITEDVKVFLKEITSVYQR